MPINMEATGEEGRKGGGEEQSCAAMERETWRASSSPVESVVNPAGTWVHLGVVLFLENTAGMLSHLPGAI